MLCWLTTVYYSHRLREETFGLHLFPSISSKFRYSLLSLFLVMCHFVISPLRFEQLLTRELEGSDDILLMVLTENFVLEFVKFAPLTSAKQMCIAIVLIVSQLRSTNSNIKTFSIYVVTFNQAHCPWPRLFKDIRTRRGRYHQIKIDVDCSSSV